MTKKNIKNIDFYLNYLREEIMKSKTFDLCREYGLDEIKDDNNIIKIQHNGTATFTIKINGGVSYNFEEEN